MPGRDDGCWTGQRESRQAAILAATGDLLSEQGSAEAVTVEWIAGRPGATKATLYRHFASKSGVGRALAEPGVDVAAFRVEERRDQSREVTAMVAIPERVARRPKVPRRAIAGLAVVLVAAIAYWWLAGEGRRDLDGETIAASGIIEADETAVAAEIGGRVSELLVDEGATVRAGDPIARLDDTLLRAQLRQSQAALETAKANLALVQAGSRPEDVRQAEAALAQAIAARDAAEKGWRNAVAMRDDPQDLKGRIDAAETQVAAAQARLDQVKHGIRPADVDAARAAVEAARANLAQVEASARAQEKVAHETLAAAEARLKLLTQGPRPEDLKAAELGLDQAKNALYAAQTNRDGVCGNAHNPKYLCDAANAQVAAAETGVASAANALAKLKNGPLPEEVRTADAAVQQARASLEAVQTTTEPALAAARAGVQSAEARLRQLEAGAPPEDLAAAAAGLDQARRNLTGLVAIRANPLAANAQVDAARGQYEAAKAAADGAQARLDALRRGPTDEQVAVARSQAAQAEAAVAVVQGQIAKLTLASPASGLVSKRSVSVGEMVSPGAAIVGVVALDPVKLTVYVPEPRVGFVRVGQVAELTVDPFPGEVFRGEVVHVAPKAEFTPRNVQSQKDRATTVFAVKVRIPNPEGKLKPGLPADARLLAQHP